MNYQKLRIDLEEVLAGKRDERFREVTQKLHCMSRPRVYAILNAIVSCMDPEELYLEVGTYQGGSLISALLDNNARAIGVDSYTEFTGTNSFERTQKNLVDFEVASRVHLYSFDYREYFENLSRETKVQVYYYDGQHDYEGQLAGMEAAWNFLQPGSLVLVDDYSYPEVRRAVNQFISNHINNIGIQFVMASMGDFEDMGEIYWNGVVVLRVF